MSAEAAEVLSAADSWRIAAAASQWKLAQKSRKRRRIVDGKMEIYDARPTPDLATTLAAARRLEETQRVEAQAKLMEDARPGQFIPDHGVYIDRWTVTFEDKNKPAGAAPLSLTFDAFAAPQDVTDKNGNNTFTFDAAVEAVNALHGWHSHSGEAYATTDDLLQALRDKTYHGGWIIPPSELLMGTDAQDDKVQAKNILALKEERDFKNTFNRAADDHDGHRPNTYWSCTKTLVNYSIRKAVRFGDGEQVWYGKNGSHLSCRPIRLERVMPPAA